MPDKCPWCGARRYRTDAPDQSPICGSTTQCRDEDCYERQIARMQPVVDAVLRESSNRSNMTLPTFTRAAIDEYKEAE